MRPSRFEDVRAELEREVRAAKAAQVLQERLAERRAALGVSIDEERLAALGEAEARAPSAPPRLAQ